MGLLPLRPCPAPGCAALTRGGYCAAHEQAPRPPRVSAKDYEAKPARRAAAVFYKTTRWKKTSARGLAAEPFCRRHLVLFGEHVAGHHRDHIVPRERAPQLAYDPANLQTLCRSCHSMKTRRESPVETDGRPAAPRYVVTGRPGSGKTTWCERHRRPGDLVFDFDSLAELLTAQPRTMSRGDLVELIEAMRFSFLQALAGDYTIPRRVFLIASNPQRAALIAPMIGAAIVTMPADREKLPQ